MSITLSMTSARHMANHLETNPADAIHGNNNFWYDVARKSDLVKDGESAYDIKATIARGLTPDILTENSAQVWGLVHDTDRRIPVILGQTLAKQEFSELPFVPAMRTKIASLNAPALTV